MKSSSTNLSCERKRAAKHPKKTLKSLEAIRVNPQSRMLLRNPQQTNRSQQSRQQKKRKTKKMMRNRRGRTWANASCLKKASISCQRRASPNSKLRKKSGKPNANDVRERRRRLKRSKLKSYLMNRSSSSES